MPKVKSKSLRIKLGDDTWRVRRQKRTSKVDGNETWGTCCHQKRIIEVSTENYEAGQRAVFLHEIMHSILPAYKEEWVDIVADQVADALDAFDELLEGG